MKILERINIFEIPSYCCEDGSFMVFIQNKNHPNCGQWCLLDNRIQILGFNHSRNSLAKDHGYKIDYTDFL